MPSDICSLLRDHIPHLVSAHACQIQTACVDDVPRELLSSRASPDRQREFAAGRIAACAALTDLGVHDYFPAVGESRQPVWPEGIVGSISHDDEFAVAICSQSVGGIGVDIDRITPLNDEDRAQFMTPLEQTDPEWSSNAGTIKLFSYKEAVFKCIYPITGQFLDFTDVEIRKSSEGWLASCTDSGNPAADQIANTQGFIEQLPGRIVSACWLSHRPSA